MQFILQFILFCLIVQYMVSEIGMAYRRKKKQKVSKEIECPAFLKGKTLNNSLSEEAIKFITEIDQKDSLLSHDANIADFEYTTNLTEFNRQKRMNANAVYNQFYQEALHNASKINWKKLKKLNKTLYRWFQLFTGDRSVDNSIFLNQKVKSSYCSMSMREIFSEARVCTKKSSKKSKCNITLFPGVNDILEISRDPDELQHLWKQVRDATGKKMRKKFIKHVRLANEGARNINFRDAGEWMRHEYESDTFVSDMSKVMKKIQPLYEKFHAYVRKKLMKFYKNVYIKEDGPIPAHLLGDIYAQEWLNIFDITKPSKKETINVTDILHQRNMETIDMVKLAENFFVSLGLERMTPHFWAKSVLEKPTDRDMVCNAAAYDMNDRKDFRIRMCNKKSEESLYTIFHEMGHIEQFMMYRNLSKQFRESANPGFHEAMGDVVTLSVSNLDYLKKVGFVNESVEYDDDLEIAYLFKTALYYLPSIPYAYIMDHYRYHVYNGSISSKNLNRMWWKYRLEYQGVCPPVKRTEKDFDPGAKYHIAYDVEYMRYFIANIVAFQMHKGLCKVAGHNDDLFKCCIYRNAAAGKLFKKALSFGRLYPWQKILKLMTGDTRTIDPEPFLEYFKKLETWLDSENNDSKIGWKSKSPMVCPHKRVETTALRSDTKPTASIEDETTPINEEKATDKEGTITATDKGKTTLIDEGKLTSTDEEETTSIDEGETTSIDGETTTNEEKSNPIHDETTNQEKTALSKEEKTTTSIKEDEQSSSNEKVAAVTNEEIRIIIKEEKTKFHTNPQRRTSPYTKKETTLKIKIKISLDYEEDKNSNSKEKVKQTQKRRIFRKKKVKVLLGNIS